MRFIALLLLALTACSHPRSGPQATAAHATSSPRLVLISVDGMRPDFYTRPEYQNAAPTLARLAREGERAEYGIEPVYPSVTYPNHTAMVTGAYPAQNGVVDNRIFSPGESKSESWYWKESDIHVPTLWQVAEKAGLKVALIRWPATVGAKVHWDLPDYFSTHAWNIGEDWELIRQNSVPEKLQQYMASDSIAIPKKFSDLDMADTQVAVHLLRDEDPDVLMLHLLDLDHVQHQVGTESPEVIDALRGIESHLKSVIDFLDPSKTTVIVTGDHGFTSYQKKIHLKSLIQAAKVEVAGQSDGGQAVIYPVAGHSASNPCQALAAEAAKDGVPTVQALSRKQLNALHAFPGALCGLESGMGAAFDDKLEKEVVESLDHPRGHHGYLPSRREMRAGFLIWGKKISHPGKTIPGDGAEKTTLHMIDIAPTAAKILGLTFHVPAGHAMRF